MPSMKNNSPLTKTRALFFFKHDIHHFSQEPGTQLSWGEEDGPDLFTVDLSVFVLTLFPKV